MITILKWDSDFFGFPTARALLDELSQVSANQLLSQITEKRIKLLYLFHDLSVSVDNQWKSNYLSTLGASLVDTKIVFAKELPEAKQYNLPDTISDFNHPNATNRLYEIALESGIYSRFRLDPHIPAGSYERMYRLWLDNSVNRKIADYVLVSKDDANTINGMVTLAIKDRSAVIGLIAVHPDGQGKGIGSRLMQAAEYFTVHNGKKNIKVATQKANTPACRFYEKAGYSVESEVEVWHWWDSK